MKKVKIAIVLNIIILLLVFLATIMMFTGIRFTQNDMILESKNIMMFKFFTVDSNVLMGISALIAIIFQYKYIKNNINIPKWVYIVKQLSTTSVMITFFVTALFLAPMLSDRFLLLYVNSNLFYHLIIPILSLLVYILYESYDNKYSYMFYGLIPVILYSIVYILNIIIHSNNLIVDKAYDFYNFLNGNLMNIFIVIPVMLTTTLLISFVLILLNKKILK